MIMSQSLVAKQYATAYVNVYLDKLTPHDVEQMSKVVHFFKKHSNMMTLIEIHSYQDAKHIEVLVTLLQKFNIAQVLEKLVDVLYQNKQVGYFPEVLQDICCLYNKRKKMLQVEIKTAHELEKDEVEKLEQFFSKLSGRKVLSNVTIDKSLLLGVRLQSDIFLWEYSVASALQKLRKKLLFEGY